MPVIQDFIHPASNFATFSGAFEWIIIHGYALMFIAMLFEGPVVTLAAAFASAFGYFNIFIVFVLSFFGDALADIAYYYIGYFSRLAFIERFGKYVGLSEKKMKRIENLLHDHSVKTLIALKLTPGIPTPGLMLVGTTHMPIKKYATICSLIILPRTIFLVFIGYYFGAAYEMYTARFQKDFFMLMIIFALAFLAYFAVRKLLSRLAKRIERV